MLSWILGLIAIGFLFVLYPFVFNKDSSIAKGKEQSKIAEKDNIRRFKEQLEQFQRQFDGGDIDAQQFKRLLAEAEHLLLANTTLESQQKPKDLAGGLWLNEYGDFAGGRASAGAAAGTDEAATIIHNPASSTRIEGSQLFGSVGALIPKIEFDVKDSVPFIGDGDGGQAGGCVQPSG